MGLFYIYEHWRPDTDACFYVGKGSGRRANVMDSRNRYHNNVQKKLACLGMCVEVRLFAEGLAEEEAFDLEIERIAFWRGMGVPLANLTDGGEGGSNPSESTRALMRKAKLGAKLTAEHKAKIGQKSKISGNDPAVRAKAAHSAAITNATLETYLRRSQHSKSMVRTAEHCEKISQATMGRKQSAACMAKLRASNLGRKHTSEEIEKRRAANTGRLRTAEQKQHMHDAQTPERIAKRLATRAVSTAVQRDAVPLTGVLRTCLRCKQQKDSSKFGARKLSPDGIHLYCKECRSKEKALAKISNMVYFADYLGGCDDR
jgi:hypothetical protein